MKIDWNVGDDRSYGSFCVSDAPTKLGSLKFSYLLDQAGSIFEVREFTIGGHDADKFCENFHLDYPDIGAPHDSSGQATINRFATNQKSWTKKAINEWLNGFVETLKELAAEGVPNPWNVA